MQIQEQIYTSAKQLLNSDQGDLGVIAETVGFPRLIAREINRLASYRIMESLPIDDPKAHPPRFVIGSRGETQEYFGVSRIVFAGADHSGRTTPLAHHVFATHQALEANRIDASDMIRSLGGFFSDDWQRPPERFDPPRDVEIQSDAKAPMPSNAWTRTTGSRNTANFLGWIAERFTSGVGEVKPPLTVVLGHELGDAILNIISDIYRVLPASFQRSLSVQSHVIKASDVVGSPAILFTYPGSDYLAEVSARSGKRKPVIVDFTSSETLQFSNSDFGQWIEKQVAASASRSAMGQGIRIRGSLGIVSQSEEDVFIRTVRLYKSFQKPDWLSEVDLIGGAIASISTASTDAATYTRELSEKAVEKHFIEYQRECNWGSLAKITRHECWPESTRDLAKNAFLAFPTESWKLYFDAIELSRWPPELSQWIQRAKNSSTNVAGPFIESIQGEIASRLRKREMTVESAKPLVIELEKSTDEAGRRRLVYDVVESVVTEPTQLNQMIRWIDAAFQCGGGFFDDYETSGHSPEAVEAIEKFRTPPPSPPPLPSADENGPSATQSGGEADQKSSGAHEAPPILPNHLNSSQRRATQSHGYDPTRWVLMSCGVGVVVMVYVAYQLWTTGLGSQPAAIATVLCPIAVSVSAAFALVWLLNTNTDKRKIGRISKSCWFSMVAVLCAATWSVFAVSPYSSITR